MALWIVLAAVCWAQLPPPTTAQQDFLLVNWYGFPSGVYRVWLHTDTWERLPITNSTIPLAVTYDPVSELVFWSESSPDFRIYSAYANGSSVEQVLETGAGVAGLTVNSAQGILYYTQTKPDYIIGAYSIDRKQVEPFLYLRQPTYPYDVSYDASNSLLYYADKSTDQAVQIRGNWCDPTVVFETLDLADPQSIAIGHTGELLYVCGGPNLHEFFEVAVSNASVVRRVNVPGVTCNHMEVNSTHLFIVDATSKQVLVAPLFRPEDAVAISNRPAALTGTPFGMHYESYQSNPARSSTGPTGTPCTTVPTSPTTTSTTSQTTSQTTPVKPYTTSQPTSATTKQGGSSSASDGALSQEVVIGIGAGAAAFVILLLVIIGAVLCLKRKSKPKEQSPNTPAVTSNGSQRRSTSDSEIYDHLNYEHMHPNHQATIPVNRPSVKSASDGGYLTPEQQRRAVEFQIPKPQTPSIPHEDDVTVPASQRWELEQARLRSSRDQLYGGKSRVKYPPPDLLRWPSQDFVENDADSFTKEKPARVCTRRGNHDHRGSEGSVLGHAAEQRRDDVSSRGGMPRHEITRSRPGTIPYEDVSERDSGFTSVHRGSESAAFEDTRRPFPGASRSHHARSQAYGQQYNEWNRRPSDSVLDTSFPEPEPPRDY